MKYYGILFTRKSGKVVKILEHDFGDAFLKMIYLTFAQTWLESTLKNLAFLWKIYFNPISTEQGATPCKGFTAIERNIK